MGRSVSTFTMPAADWIDELSRELLVDPSSVHRALIAICARRGWRPPLADRDHELAGGATPVSPPAGGRGWVRGTST